MDTTFLDNYSSMDEYVKSIDEMMNNTSPKQ